MPVPKWLVIGMFAAALIGFADSAYITAQHMQGLIPPCGIEGCETVLTSRYADISGVPTSVIGMLFYGTVLVLLIAWFDTGNRKLLHIVSWLACAAFLFTLFLVALQLFVLDAICLYCMVSALSSTVLFILAIILMRRD